MASFITSRDRARFYVPVDCLESRGMETHRVLLVLTPLVFAYYSDWMFKGRFWSLTFTIARSELAGSAMSRPLRTTTGGVLSTERVDDHVQIRKPLLVALRPCVVHPIASMNVNEMVYDCSYDLADMIMTWETMRAEKWPEFSSFPEAQKLP